VERLNYHHLYYFWKVAKEASFTKAADELRIAQSAVSSQVASLEDFLGKTLILRSTSKRLSLTEEGQIVFDQAEEIFRQGKDLVDGIRDGGLHSSFRFGAIGSLSKNLQIKLLKPILENRDFELSIDVGDSTTLLSRLRDFRLDAILCDVPFSFSEDEPLIQLEIAKEPFCLVSNKKTGRAVIGDLLEQRGVYLPSRSNPATSEIEAWFGSQKIKPRIRGYIDDIAFLRLVAIETDALVAIPKIGAELDLAAGRLFAVHQFRSLHQNFYLVLRPRGPRSTKILSILRPSIKGL
jgi:LysR family transcriptional regulator, transcriptional activator of nhaA